MLLACVDPGSEKSAWLLFDTETMLPYRPGSELLATIDVNESIASWLAERAGGASYWADRLIIEMPRIFPGGKAGNDLRDTLLWTGQFIRAWGGDRYTGIERQDVYRYLLGKPTGSDPQVNSALYDRYGGSRKKAVGTKKAPGPLYGIKSHLWAALAVAVTYCDMQQFEKEAGDGTAGD